MSKIKLPTPLGRMVVLAMALASAAALSHAQAASFGIGAGAFTINPNGQFSISTQLNLPVFAIDAFSVSGRVNADLVIGSKTDANLLISPLLNYTINPLVITPVTLYIGPVVRAFVQDVFSETRVVTWSFVGAVAGASVSVLGFVEPYAEASVSFGALPQISYTAGVRFAF
jgi:hypothetical protein